MMNLPKFKRPVLLLTTLFLVSACASYTGVWEARQAEETGDWDTAVLHYLELTEREPNNLSYRTGLMRAQMKASQEHLENGRLYSEAGSLDAALRELQKAVQLDRSNQLAQVELEKARRAVAERESGKRGESIEEMKKRAAAERSQPPILKPADEEPIDLSFPQPQDVKIVYRALCAAAGINVLFAPDLRDATIPIELTGVTFQQGLELVMRSAGHFYKVYAEDTIFIADDTQQNRRLYEDQMIQSFFLSNADPEAALNVLRALVGARNVVSNEDLNAIVIKDSADRVRVAEQIIDTFDKARGEVVVDVELLEVNTSDLQDLGVSLSAYQIGQGLNFENNQVPLSQVEFLNQSDWILSLPSLIYDFVKEETNAEILARPQLRISDGEDADLTIGEQVPVPVTSFNSSQTVGGNIVPLTSFQYRDIGIKIQITPRIHHNNEVSLVASIEVSSITGFAPATGGVSQPLIGTRRIESTIRLKNGETNFLAGLLRTDNSVSSNGVPGLSEIPVLGRLFSKKRKQKDRTDLVLTITPHIVRMPDITPEDLAPIWVGTEESFSFRGGSPRIESEERGPFDGEQASELQQRLRRQLEELPRDLRENPDADADEEEAPDTSIVDPSGPSSLGDGRDNSWIPGKGSLASPFQWVVASNRILQAQTESEPAHAVEVFLAVNSAVSSQRGSGGDQLGVAIKVDSQKEIAHLPMVIEYDPTLLKFAQMTTGTFLGSDSETTAMAHERKPGRLVIGISRLGDGVGFHGQGEAAVLQFYQVAQGESEIVIRHVAAMTPDLSHISDVHWSGVRVVTNEHGFIDRPVEADPKERANAARRTRRPRP